jgi:hypothetical protein
MPLAPLYKYVSLLGALSAAPVLTAPITHAVAPSASGLGYKRPRGVDAWPPARRQGIDGAPPTGVLIVTLSSLQVRRCCCKVNLGLRGLILMQVRIKPELSAPCAGVIPKGVPLVALERRGEWLRVGLEAPLSGSKPLARMLQRQPSDVLSLAYSRSARTASHASSNSASVGPSDVPQRPIDEASGSGRFPFRLHMMQPPPPSQQTQPQVPSTVTVVDPSPLRRWGLSQAHGARRRMGYTVPEGANEDGDRDGLRYSPPRRLYLSSLPAGGRTTDSTNAGTSGSASSSVQPPPITEVSDENARRYPFPFPFPGALRRDRYGERERLQPVPRSGQPGSTSGQGATSAAVPVIVRIDGTPVNRPIDPAVRPADSAASALRRTSLGARRHSSVSSEPEREQRVPLFTDDELDFLGGDVPRPFEGGPLRQAPSQTGPQAHTQIVADAGEESDASDPYSEVLANLTASPSASAASASANAAVSDNIGDEFSALFGHPYAPPSLPVLPHDVPSVPSVPAPPSVPQPAPPPPNNFPRRQMDSPSDSAPGTASGDGNSPLFQGVGGMDTFLDLLSPVYESEPEPDGRALTAGSSGNANPIPRPHTPLRQAAAYDGQPQNQQRQQQRSPSPGNAHSGLAALIDAATSTSTGAAGAVPLPGTRAAAPVPSTLNANAPQFVPAALRMTAPTQPPDRPVLSLVPRGISISANATASTTAHESSATAAQRERRYPSFLRGFPPGAHPGPRAPAPGATPASGSGSRAEGGASSMSLSQFLAEGDTSVARPRTPERDRDRMRRRQEWLLERRAELQAARVATTRPLVPSAQPPPSTQSASLPRVVAEEMWTALMSSSADTSEDHSAGPHRASEVSVCANSSCHQYFYVFDVHAMRCRASSGGGAGAPWVPQHQTQTRLQAVLIHLARRMLQMPGVAALQ